MPSLLTTATGTADPRSASGGTVTFTDSDRNNIRFSEGVMPFVEGALGPDGSEPVEEEDANAPEEIELGLFNTRRDVRFHPVDVRDGCDPARRCGVESAEGYSRFTARPSVATATRLRSSRRRYGRLRRIRAARRCSITTT